MLAYYITMDIIFFVSLQDWKDKSPTLYAGMIVVIVETFIGAIATVCNNILKFLYQINLILILNLNYSNLISKYFCKNNLLYFCVVNYIVIS